MASSAQALVQIIGRINSVYNNQREGTKRLKVYTSQQQKEHCVIVPKGCFCPVQEGDAISAICRIEDSPRYGEQLVIERPPWVEVGVARDTVVQCFIKFLRGTGFGNMRAQKLYDEFTKYSKTDEKGTVSYITELASRYMKSDDKAFFPLYDNVVTEKQMSKLLKLWYKQRSLRRLYLLGLNNKEIRSIQRRSHDQIYEQCLKNPFVVVEIPLDKAIQIMQRLSKPIEDDELRRAQITRKIYELNNGNGWTGVPSYRLCGIFPDLNQHMDKLRDEYEVEGELRTVYLPYPYEVEVEMASIFTDMAHETFDVEKGEDPNFLRKTLTEEQKRAVQVSLDNPISIITGAPGTGKTSIISEVIHNLELRDISYAVASFTGKAVARIREVIGKRKASTMHKMIAKASSYSDFQVLILDEVSMITLDLMYQFILKFGKNYSVILVGDVDQLKPISWGDMFGQLLAAHMVPTVRLTKNHRIVPGFDINGIAINSRRIIEYDSEDPEFCDGFSFVSTENFQLIPGSINTIYDIIRALITAKHKAEDIRIVTPYNHCIDEINATCQVLFNDGQEYVTDSRGKTWMVNDLVMMTQNNYDINIMNGEEGKVVSVSLDKGTIDCEFEGHGTFTFLLEPTQKELIDEWLEFSDGEKVSSTDELTVTLLRLCYASTVHKVQGSEWSFVIFYVPEHRANKNFLNKNLIYTAITRAKLAVWCVGAIEDIYNGATNNPPYRCDNLAIRMSKLMQEKMEETKIVDVTEDDDVARAPTIVTEITPTITDSDSIPVTF